MTHDAERRPEDQVSEFIDALHDGAFTPDAQRLEGSPVARFEIVMEAVGLLPHDRIDAVHGTGEDHALETGDVAKPLCRIVTQIEVMQGGKLAIASHAFRGLVCEPESDGFGGCVAIDAMNQEPVVPNREHETPVTRAEPHLRFPLPTIRDETSERFDDRLFSRERGKYESDRAKREEVHEDTSVDPNHRCNAGHAERRECK
ncbi:MAG: hypothetical protein IPH13_03410 [Planctomycetes bacterium]|nr:hypothetical protein [Planctomycetota bacterium]MCC7171688.1 hypothetical protein [Planctomycetota bacterium]